MSLKNVQIFAAPKEPVAGPLYAWGASLPHVLPGVGDGNAARSSPVQVGSQSWISIASGNGDDWGAAVRSDGALFIWGTNSYGTRGMGNTTQTYDTTYAQLGSMSWSSVFSGATTLYALDKSGNLWAWGSNTFNAVGTTTRTPIFNSTTGISAGNVTLDRFGTGDNFLVSAGDVWAIGGDNTYSQLGNATTTANSNPVVVDFTTGVVDVRQGGGVVAAVKNDGSLWMWGLGPTGSASPLNEYNPTNTASQRANSAYAFSGNPGDLSIGKSHGAAINSSGVLYTWGDNSSGQLGNNSTSAVSYVTQETMEDKSFLRVSCGDLHTAAIDNSNGLWTWGDNTYGQLGVFTAGSGGGGGGTATAYSGGPFMIFTVDTGSFPNAITVTLNSTDDASKFAAMVTLLTTTATIQVWYQNTLYMFNAASATATGTSVSFPNIQNAFSQYNPNSDQIRGIVFTNPSSISNYNSGPEGSSGTLDISFLGSEAGTAFTAAAGSSGTGISNITIYDYQYANTTYIFTGIAYVSGGSSFASVTYTNKFTSGGSYPGLQMSYTYIPSGTTGGSSGGGSAGGSWTISDVDWSGPTASVLGIFFGGPTAATDSLAFKEALISGGSFTIAGAMNTNQNPPSPYISADVTVTGTPNYQSSGATSGIVYWFSGSFTVTQTGGSPGASTVTVAASSGGGGGSTPTTFQSPHIYYDGFMFRMYFNNGTDYAAWGTFASATGTATVTYNGTPYTMSWTGPWSAVGAYYEKTGVSIAGLGNIADQFGSFSVTYTAASSSGGTSTTYILYTGQSNTGYQYQGMDNYIDSHMSGNFYFAGPDYQAFLSAAPATFTYDSGQTIYSISGASMYSYGGMGSVSLSFNSATPTGPGSGTPKITVASSGSSSGGTTVTKTLDTGAYPSGFYNYGSGNYMFQSYMTSGVFYFQSPSDRDAVLSATVTTFTFKDAYNASTWTLGGIMSKTPDGSTSVSMSWSTTTPAAGGATYPPTLSWTSAGGSSGGETTYTVSGGPYGNGFYSSMYGGYPGPNGPGNAYIYFSSSADASAFLAAAPTTFYYNDGAGAGSKYTFTGVSGLSSNGPSGVQFSWTDYSFSTGTPNSNTVTLPASSGGGGDTGADVKIGNASSPVQVGSGAIWIDVACGEGTTYAIKNDGTLWSWGKNTNGQLGHGNTTDLISPVQVSSQPWNGANVNWVSAGHKNVIIGTSSGVYGAGANASAQLYWDSQQKSEFVLVASGPSWIEGEVNNSNVLLKNSDYNQVFASGNNNFGQFGTGNQNSNPGTPQEIATQIPPIVTEPLQTLPSYSYGHIKSIDSGSNNLHRVVLTQSGSIVAWGDNSHGQTKGDGSSRGFPSLGSSTSDSGVTVDTLLDTPRIYIGGSWSQVAAGDLHTIAIKSDRTLWAWGDNSEGQLGIGGTIFSRSSISQVGSDKWNQIAACGSMSFGIKLDGTLWAWGNSYYGGAHGTSTTTTPYSWTMVSSNQGSIYYTGCSTLAIRADGTLWAWGLGESFTSPSPPILGLGDVYTRNSPNQVGNSSWTTVSAGFFGSVGIDTAGRLFNWGVAANNSNNITSSSPVQVGVETDWVFASAGIANFAIKSNGTLYGWGARQDNTANPALGINSLNGSVTPTQIPGSWTTVQSALISNENRAGVSVGIKSDGTLWSWGGYTYSQTDPRYISVLGDGTAGTRSSPVQIGAGQSWAQVMVNPGNIFALTTAGKLYGSGNNYNYQLSVGGKTPVYSWSQVSVGHLHTLAISSDGGLWAWGSNFDYGQVGLGHRVSTIPHPTKIGNSSWSQVAAAYNSSFAIRSDGTLWAWGDNTYGKLGVGDTQPRSSPVQVSGGGSSWTKITGNQWVTLGIQTGQGIAAWGSNNSGLFGSPAYTAAVGITLSSPVVMISGETYSSISAGYRQAAFITSDGRLFTWGEGTNGQLGDSTVISKSSPVQIGAGAGLSWSSISAGNHDTGNGTGMSGIKSNGTLWSWGTNTSGQLGIGNTTAQSSPTQVGSGTYIQVSRQGLRTLAVNSSGTLYGWGALGFTTTSNPMIIASDTYDSILSGNIDTYLIRKASNSSLWAGTTLTSSPLAAGIGNRRDNLNNRISNPVQVGNNECDYAATLVPIGDESWTQVSAGYWQGSTGSTDYGSTVFGIKPDGSLWYWGLGATAKVLHGNINNVSSPVQLGTSSWTFVTAHANGVTARKIDGTLWTAGYDIAGTLGIGNEQWTYVSNLTQIGNNTIPIVRAPMQVGTSQWKSITAWGTDHIMGIKLDGTAWSWGVNNNWSNGLNSGQNSVVSSPVQVGESNSRWLAVLPGTSGLAIKRP